MIFITLILVPTDENPSKITLNHDNTNTLQEQEQIRTLQQESSQEQIKTLQQESSQEEEVINTECNNNLIAIAKSEWGGRPPKHDSTHLEKPIKKVIIQSTYTDKCTTQV